MGLHFAVKIDSAAGFSATGVALTQRLAEPGPGGIITIVAPTTDPVGPIDPDISRSAGGSGRELLLQSIFFKVDGVIAGSSGDEITVVDDAGVDAFQVADLNGPIPFYSDRRWVIPVGYRLLVNFAGAGVATLQLNFWVLESPEQLVAAPPVGTP